MRNRYELIADVLNQLTQAREARQETNIIALENQLTQAWQDWQGDINAQKEAKEQIETIHQQLVTELGSASAFTQLNGQIPLVLLPVRLETRYFADDDQHYELRVRIFPDDIHINDYQSVMSTSEYELTRLYWDARLAEGINGENTILRWHELCHQVGQGRAMWLAGKLDPFGRWGKFATGDNDGVPPPFPDVEVAPEDWTESATADNLPDQWVIVGYRGTKRLLLHWTSPVSPQLQVSPDVGKPGAELLNEDENSDNVSAGIEWLNDFNIAESKGMAARIKIKKIIARSLDKILVFGICASQTETETKQNLESLLESHQCNNLVKVVL